MPEFTATLTIEAPDAEAAEDIRGEIAGACEDVRDSGEFTGRADLAVMETATRYTGEGETDLEAELVALTDRDREIVREALDFYSDACDNWEEIEEVSRRIARYDKITLRHEED